ncbi:MAG: transposase [Saprospiraceae bacterium]|nr:transposase [Saprospiraceae bacterium]MBK8518993.1 transposase [Saprospiraceae bacterium]MBL0024053.1 transposase [Saprospiraceae bacterium]
MSTKRTRKVFSESFKKQKVELIESGKLTTGSVATQFDVSYTAVYQWVKKFGKATRPDKIVIESDSDYLKVLELQKISPTWNGLLASNKSESTIMRH